MSESRRLVTVFMAVGLVLAICVGLLVWKMSAPSTSADTSYQADAVEATVSDTARSSTPPRTAPESVSTTQASAGDTQLLAPRTAAEGAPNHANDPLLPPNAVVNAAPRDVSPTQVYRPSNVIPTSVAPASEDGLRSGATAERETAQTAEPEAAATSQPAVSPTQPATASASSAATSEPATATAAQEPAEEATASTHAQEAAPQSAPVQDQPAPAQQAPAQQAPASAQEQPETVQQGVPSSADPLPWWERFRGMLS
ncbi:hypothetical protein [Corynebacterium qintianiae]|uniref:hypothetical protein n=1 Tax=Corynebacterium qintianiae TaxID=2709392 RepID=UPI0013EBA810|nr:hypothetical protein [Corynebacterium qintianiae]